MSRRPKKNNQSGFTLIEMLIVIAVIAILSGIVLTGISGFQASARDTKRIADLRSTQNLLELYFNACGRYPGEANCSSDDINGGDTSWTDLRTAITGKLGISNFPEPPGGMSDPIANKIFRYDVHANGTSYLLGAELEGDSSALRDSFVAPDGLAEIDCGEGASADGGNVFCITSE